MLLEIQDTLKGDGTPRGPVRPMKKAVNVSLAVMTAFYYAIAVTGYAVWGDTDANKFGRMLPDDVLTGYPGPKWVREETRGRAARASADTLSLAHTLPPSFLQAIVLSNVLVLLHMIPAYQVWSQPLFECTELAVEARVHARGGKWPLGLSQRSFRIVFRSTYVVLTTFFACLIPFMGVILGERRREERDGEGRRRRREASPVAHAPPTPPLRPCWSPRLLASVRVGAHRVLHQGVPPAARRHALPARPLLHLRHRHRRLRRVGRAAAGRVGRRV